MKSLRPGDDSPVRPSGQTSTDGGNGDERSAVVGNERLTALASAVLLVLIVVELVSSASLRTLLPIHIFIGVGLSGPLVVKIGSTGYRFLRYYTRSPAFVRRGPPHLALRVLAPLLLVTTLVVIGSGIGLVVTGPERRSLAPGRGLRLGVNIGALLVGAVAAILLFPSATPWLVWSQTSQMVSAALIAGLIIATLVLLVTRPFRWK